mgnify:FL=1|jgi:hypothetical protein
MFTVGYDKEKNQWTLFNCKTETLSYFESKRDLEDYLDAHAG